jgi:beta-ribofuranosylaminobenzene 5'-phosphate synthase
MSAAASVFVEAPARLHFGVLDLRGALGRRFGGLGAAIPTPSLMVEVAPSRGSITAEGPDADRAAAFARRFLEHHRLRDRAHVIVHRPIPAHSGLGSGTQLGLAVARALAELHELPTDPTALARAVDRGRRSAIGTWAFALGGFIVEGGRRPGDEGVAPLIGRYQIPEGWRCVVAIPPGSPGLSGDAEAAAFAQLPPPPQGDVERVSHLVLMQLLPALVQGDIGSFGAALSEVQRITGAWFAPQQGGVFAPGPGETLIRRLAEWEAAGVGQSSWGPAVYGLVDGEAAGRALAIRCREFLGGSGQVFEGGFARSGARIGHGGPPSGTD